MDWKRETVSKFILMRSCLAELFSLLKNRGIEKSYLHFNFFENHKRRNLWMEGEWFCLSFFVRIKTMDKFIVQALTNGSSQICGAGRSYFLFRAALMPCIFIYAPQQASWRILCALFFLVYVFRCVSCYFCHAYNLGCVRSCIILRIRLFIVCFLAS